MTIIKKNFKCKYSKKSKGRVPDSTGNLFKRAGKAEALWKPYTHSGEQENNA